MTRDAIAALTDLVLALESGYFAWKLVLAMRSWPSQGLLWALFYASIGLAAAAGGAVHGFFPEYDSKTAVLLWRLTLFCIGGAGLAAWSIGAEFLLSAEGARRAWLAAGSFYAAYSVVVLGYSEDFRIAVLYYAPAVVFMSSALAMLWVRTGERDYGFGAAGGALALVASFLQQKGIGLHPVYFDSSALYHVLEAVALYLAYRSGRRLLADPAVQAGKKRLNRRPVAT